MGVVPAVSDLPMGALWTQSAYNWLSLWSRVCGLALTSGVRKTWKRGQRLSVLTLLAWHVVNMGDV